MAKAGLTLSATLNYQLLPEVTSDVCYNTKGVKVKNCIGIYHQWTDNYINLYAWYAWRGWCGWFVSPEVIVVLNSLLLKNGVLIST